MTHDAVNHPSHYTSHPSGIECLQITRGLPFTLGNAVDRAWVEVEVMVSGQEIGLPL